MSWSSQKKKEGIFCTVDFVRRKLFFNICVLSQCIVYWTNFQNRHTFTYQKTLLHTLLLLFFKIIESLQCILKDTLKAYFWHSLCEKCPNTELFLVHIFLYSDWIQENMDTGYNPNTGKYGPEITPHLDSFHAVIVTRCSTLWLWVGYFIYFKSTPVFF